MSTAKTKPKKEKPWTMSDEKKALANRNPRQPSNMAGFSQAVDVQKSMMGDRTPNTINIGQVVFLVSGGPLMTVQKVHSRDAINSAVSVRCSWFDVARNLHQKDFDAETLMVSGYPYNPRPWPAPHQS